MLTHPARALLQPFERLCCRARGASMSVDDAVRLRSRLGASHATTMSCMGEVWRGDKIYLLFAPHTLFANRSSYTSNSASTYLSLWLCRKRPPCSTPALLRGRHLQGSQITERCHHALRGLRWCLSVKSTAPSRIAHSCEQFDCTYSVLPQHKVTTPSRLHKHLSGPFRSLRSLSGEVLASFTPRAFSPSSASRTD